MAGESKTTTDHDEIRCQVEERGGRPATVKGTQGGDAAGVLRTDFPGRGDDEDLEELSWEEFFSKFQKSNLAFLYQETTADGEESRFNTFVSR